MPFITVTTLAQQAAQYLGILDSGESLSTQQLSDALTAVNNLLDSWTTEQVRIINLLVQSFVLAGGTYTQGTEIQWPDTVTAELVPVGYPQAIALGLAIQLAPQYGMTPSPALIAQYKEARAAAQPLLTRLMAAGVPFMAADAPGTGGA